MTGGLSLTSSFLGSESDGPLGCVEMCPVGSGSGGAGAWGVVGLLLPVCLHDCEDTGNVGEAQRLSVPLFAQPRCTSP